MITVRLMGGLGNQLFQWAFGKAMFHRGLNVQYDISAYDGQTSRRLALEFLGINWTRVLDSSSVNEGSLRFNPIHQLAHDWGQTYVGYWQTEKYFAHIGENIRRQFNMSLHASNVAKSHAVAITGKRNSVAVHIRRGDYLNPNTQAYHGLLDIRYYRQAIALMREALFDPFFYIFSDDSEYVQGAFEFLGDRHKVIRDSRHECEDMWLMSKCQHAIIANSSFSWWGAWLNDANSDRIVVAPRNWFASSEPDSTDIVPERWTRI